MKKKILPIVNLLLGAASITLAGCHTQKAAKAEEPAAQEVRQGKVRVKYGVPPEVRERIEAERAAQDTVPADTIVLPAHQLEDPAPVPADRPIVMYGVPNPRIEPQE